MPKFVKKLMFLAKFVKTWVLYVKNRGFQVKIGVFHIKTLVFWSKSDYFMRKFVKNLVFLAKSVEISVFNVKIEVFEVKTVEF